MNSLPTYMFLNIFSVFRNHTTKHGILAERLIIHEFSGSKGCHGIKETVCCSIKVANRHGIKGFIRLEPISSIPVSTLFYQSVHMEASQDQVSQDYNNIGVCGFGEGEKCFCVF